MFSRRTGLLLSASAFLGLTVAAAAQTTGAINKGPSGLPLPRFVSLKATKVNLRVGPGQDYAVAYRYVKSGLPLEVIQEYDNWRRVRDADGTTGWIHGSLLSGARTAITSPWRKGSDTDETVVLFDTPSAQAGVIAYIEPGVIGEIESCDGAWCEFEVTYDERTLRGYVNQAELWGAYPDEVIK
ncbi:SH3 domain-containing protein [Oricola thermophila]|uniref:SH3 domain-containing protein n=1 Tax=Oricola thermophila TaxID=2742145 RepID=A0A6N1VG55_9HYPH|nr:SH3 domain-containing protein [Oricola thermophila]QKV19523.1 SH3 domain-containing protein [Oricola thermophila]